MWVLSAIEGSCVLLVAEQMTLLDPVASESAELKCAVMVSPRSRLRALSFTMEQSAANVVPGSTGIMTRMLLEE